MKLFSRSFLFIIFFFFHINAYSMWDDDDDSCESLKLSKALSMLKLNPSTKDNGSFLAQVMIEFGPDIMNDMIKKHPILKNDPKGAVDLNTIHWFLKSYNVTSVDAKITANKIFLSTFTGENGGFGADSMIRTMVGDSFPSLLTIPGFFSEEQLKKVKESYLANDYRLPINYFVLYFRLDRMVAKTAAKELYDKIFTQENHITPSKLKKIKENRSIQLQGHGEPGTESIVESGASMHYSEVVDVLVNSSIPPHVKIELPHCFGACSLELGEDSKTDKTSEELIEMFRKKKMETLFGDIKLSYSYKFSKELYSKWTHYRNDIISFRGAVSFLETGAWVRDKSDPTKLQLYTVPAVGWLDSSGSYVYFDKNEFKYVHKKEHFQ